MAKKRDEQQSIMRAQKIRIKKGHRLFDYCDQMCFASKNLYNTTNFYIRQIFTGLRKDPDQMQPNELEALRVINENIPEANMRKIAAVEKSRTKQLQKPVDSQKTIKDPKLFDSLGKENRYVSYELLEAIFKVTDQADYRNMPAHANQHTMKLLFQDWKSYFASAKDYKINPKKYLGKPKPPRYAKKHGRKTCVLTNQVCKIKDSKYLKFPKTKLQLNIGKLGLTDGKLKEVRIVPDYDCYSVELIFEHGELPEAKSENPKRIFGIDLGVNNFATIVNNVGEPPIIIKGGVIKSVNQYYNKSRAHYHSVLRQGMSPKQGKTSSRRLQRLDKKRFSKVKDFCHKASKRVVAEAEALRIDTIIVGKNDGWKQNVEMRRDDKQNFVGIPYNLFIGMLKYKAAAVGITVIETEESYTSKASFLDRDPLPKYDEGNEVQFSGRRVKRGLYRSNDGILLNADVNGAGNIIRKVVPTAFEQGDRGFVANPLVLSIA